MRRTWTNPEEIKEMFEILASLKGNRSYISSVAGDVKKWSEDCAITAKIISKKFGTERTGAQVEMQTLFPCRKFKKKTKFTPAQAENFGYAILTGFLSVDDLNEVYL